MASVRKGVVGVLLVSSFAALGGMLATRNHQSAPPTAQPKHAAESKTTTPAVAQKGDSAQSPGKGKAADRTPAAKASVGEPGPAAQSPPLDRSVRVISLGWDLAVPGHLANQGVAEAASALEKRKLKVEWKAVTDLSAIKSALANGGAHKSGADIAILPLPEMVASYEDLRALKPQIFFIVGWSRGRDALFTHRQTSLLKVARSGYVDLAGSRGSSSMLLSLYLLDIAGVRSKLIRIRSAADRGIMFSAVDRGRTAKIPKDASLAVTSADASALIPFVAIAPQGFLQNRRAVAAWVSAWLVGVRQLETDVSAAARRVSAISGAPETLSLVRRLGLIEFSGLRDNVRRAGLAGRDPVTLRRLFQLSWRLWRGVDVLTTPAPKHLPVDFDIIASLALENPGVVKEDGGRADFSTRPLVRGVAPDLESAALVAGIFARSAVRLGAYRKKKRSFQAIEDMTTRYGLRTARFEAKASLSKRNNIVLEVYSAP